MAVVRFPDEGRTVTGEAAVGVWGATGACCAGAGEVAAGGVGV